MAGRTALPVSSPKHSEDLDYRKAQAARADEKGCRYVVRKETNDIGGRRYQMGLEVPESVWFSLSGMQRLGLVYLGYVSVED